MRLRLLVATGLATASLLAAPHQVDAATATTTIAVTATVPAACTVAATALAFGTYNSASAVNASSTVTVTCVSSTAYTSDLDAGRNGALNGASTTRSMAAGAARLNYNLYQDAALSTVWATGTGSNVAGTANLAQTTTVYGNVPSGQTSTPGSYTDTVNVTVTY